MRKKNSYPFYFLVFLTFFFFLSEGESQFKIPRSRPYSGSSFVLAILFYICITFIPTRVFVANNLRVFNKGDKYYLFIYFIIVGKFGRGLLGEERKNGNVSLVLVQDRTTRKDPLDRFKKYREGWNIKERHYWAVSFLIF